MNQITIDREGARRLLELLRGVGNRVPSLYDATANAAAGDFAPLAALVGTREVKRSVTTDRTACVFCGARTAALIGAERLADACEAAVKLGPVRGGLDARSPIADALLDYRDPAEAKVATAPAPAFDLAPLAGIRIEVDPTMAPGTAELRGPRGKVTIVNIGDGTRPAPDVRVGDVVRVRPADPSDTRTIGTSKLVVTAPTLVNSTWCVTVDSGIVVPCEWLEITHRRHFKAGERCGTVAVGQVRGRVPMTYTVGQRIGDDGPRFAIHWSDGPHAPQSAVESQLFADVLAADWSADAAVPCEVRP